MKPEELRTAQQAPSFHHLVTIVQHVTPLHRCVYTTVVLLNNNDLPLRYSRTTTINYCVPPIQQTVSPRQQTSPFIIFRQSGNAFTVYCFLCQPSPSSSTYSYIPRANSSQQLPSSSIICIDALHSFTVFFYICGQLLLSIQDYSEVAFLPRRGKIEVVAGAYLRLSDGTIAGPMIRKNSNGDVFTWWGPRYLLPHADDEEATALGTVWLDGNGNAHSEPSPLDAVEVYDQSVFW